VREGAGIAFDTKDNYVVLFGGVSGTATYLSDTWTWAAGAWTKLTPTTHPTARGAPAMTYDAKDGYVVLFGGIGAASVTQSDTWKFVGGVWTKLAVTPHPSARYGAAMDYNPAASQVDLFGGLNGTTSLGDTWNFSGGHWTNLTATVGRAPSPRFAAALAYSAKDGELVLFGGDAGTGYVSDTWTFSGTSWTKISTYIHPSSRGGAMAADGPASGTVILFGGSLATGSTNDTWTFHGLVWARSFPPAPAPRALGSMTYDEADGYVLLFGGGEPGPNGGLTDSSDTWKFAQGIWTELHPSSAPAPRYAAGMTYDQADDYVVLFGGTNASGVSYLNDTWSYLAGVWTHIVTSAGPPARVDPAMTYDAAEGYVLMFGGLGPLGNFNDTWAYSGGVWWDPVTSAASPEVRVGGAMAYDSEDGYVVLYGGRGSVGNVPLFSTWTYSAGVWTNITATATAGSGYPVFGAMVDDTYDGYLLYVGGCDTMYICNTTVVTSQTWSFGNGAWTQLFPAQNPGLTDYQAIAFDPPANSVVLFGGQNGVESLATTWTY
jgi:hypothetical protein